MQINVILGGKTIYDEKGVPIVVGGEPGVMDDSELEKREGVIDNEVERTTVTEYWLNGELVHRSVHMYLKTGLFSEGVAASL